MVPSSNTYPGVNQIDTIILEFKNLKGIPIRFLDDKYWAVLEQVVLLSKSEQ
jgi:hypothetical protein